MLRRSHVSSHSVLTLTLGGRSCYLCLCHRGGPQAFEKSSTLSKFTQLGSGRAEASTQVPLSSELVLCSGRLYHRGRPVCVCVSYTCTLLVSIPGALVLPCAPTWGFLGSTRPCLFVGC